MAVKHICQKEGELGMMAQQMKDIKEQTCRIETKLDKFIDSADNKYATKTEVNELKSSLKEKELDHKEKERNIKQKTWDIILKVLPWALAIFLTGLAVYK